jgi:two-component system, response regulator, stage 0 sporulation protein F
MPDKQKKILLVDDEKSILLSLAYVLKTEGVEVITCNRSEWAEKALSNYHFDLIITDIRLSGTHGREGLEILELTKKKHPKTPVIVMTAYGSDEVQKEAKRLGAYKYFDKPVDINVLLDSIRKLKIPIPKERFTQDKPKKPRKSD